jgi:hypothetical protein
MYLPYFTKIYRNYVAWSGFPYYILATPIKRAPLYSTWGCAGQLYGFEHWEPSPVLRALYNMKVAGLFVWVYSK